MELNNLQNITLRVAINHTPPFTSLQWDSHRKKWIGIGGFEVKLIEAISQYLNFTYEFINCNNVWGTLSSNGSWNGIIGLLVNKDADIGISGISLSMDRSKAVKYLYPHLITDVTFITTQPREKSANIYLAFKPFSLNVWIGLLISILSCFLFDKLYNRIYSKRYVTKVFWFSIYSMLRQQYFIPKSDKLKSSLNIWLINWSLATFVLTTAYGGYLVSLAAIPNGIKTIDTVDELAIAAKSNEVIVTSLKHSSHTRMLINSEFKLYSQLGHLLKNVDVVNDAFKLVSSASGTRKAFSFIGNSESLRIAQLTFGEKTIHMPPQNGYSSMFINMVIVAVRTNFEYFNEFNSITKMLNYGGFLEYWKEQEYKKIFKSNLHKNPNNRSYQTFSLQQLQSVFYLLLTSIMFSTFFFICEFFHSSPMKLFQATPKKKFIFYMNNSN